MEGSGNNKQVVLMAFGLPVMTTVIVVGSMYAGHVLTTRSDRPTNVMVTAAPPKVDVDVRIPEAAPPNINVSAPPATVDVHVPQQLPPTVTVNTPPVAPPNITVSPATPNIIVSPATPTVTVIDRRDEKAVEKAPDVTAAKPVVEMPKPPVPSGLKPAIESAKPQSENTNTKADANEVKPILVSAAVPVTEIKDQPMTIDTLYDCATQYIDSYCRKHGLDPAAEARKWNRNWKSNVEQAINDNIDSGEQSYINRIVIVKRDCFNIEKAPPEKIVEACRIMLRYRDGQLAWLEAMKEALTQDNLKKTLAFLNAGPQ